MAARWLKLYSGPEKGDARLADQRAAAALQFAQDGPHRAGRQGTAGGGQEPRKRWFVDGRRQPGLRRRAGALGRFQGQLGPLLQEPHQLLIELGDLGDHRGMGRWRGRTLPAGRVRHLGF